MPDDFTNMTERAREFVADAGPEVFAITEEMRRADLIEKAATTILDAWNFTWKSNPNAMIATIQAGESWRRRFYAEVVVDFLRGLPLAQRMEAMNMAPVGYAPNTDDLVMLYAENRSDD